MYNKLLNKEAKIAIIGLGYVGLPLAVAFSKKFDVIGFDLNEEKIESYKKAVDVTGEIGDEKLKAANILFTSDENVLDEAMFYIIAVPTPITSNNNPDFKYINSASELVAKHMRKDSYILYESTVFPGVTEEICLPILENVSKLKCGNDFKLGYSPERINPGDKIHTLENIVKIVSANDDEALQNISQIYSQIIKAGIYQAESIKVAEAAKIVENTQRDVNIAFMNEISMIFNKMGLNTNDVINAASTKWNFLNFKPGLVGGHCISIDPYYLIYKSQNLGFDSRLITISREINESVADYIASNIIKKLFQLNKTEDINLLMLGFTFKENSNDIRNTKVINIIESLREFNIDIDVYDPYANKGEVKQYYNLTLLDNIPDKKYDVVVVAVSHDEFKQIKTDNLTSLLKDNGLFVDIKSCYDKNKIIKKNISYWSL